jgi:hypothetical protein
MNELVTIAMRLTRSVFQTQLYEPIAIGTRCLAQLLYQPLDQCPAMYPGCAFCLTGCVGHRTRHQTGFMCRGGRTGLQMASGMINAALCVVRRSGELDEEAAAWATAFPTHDKLTLRRVRMPTQPTNAHIEVSRDDPVIQAISVQYSEPVRNGRYRLTVRAKSGSLKVVAAWQALSCEACEADHIWFRVNRRHHFEENDLRIRHRLPRRTCCDRDPADRTAMGAGRVLLSVSRVDGCRSRLFNNRRPVRAPVAYYRSMSTSA